MDRLLSPNEAKFWLMDQADAMNSVVVTRLARPVDADLLGQGAFTLPAIRIGRQGRPRWTGDAGVCTLGLLESRPGADWLNVASDLLTRRVGTQGQPLWRAVLIADGGESTIVLAVHHALTDWRSSCWVADHFINGTDPGPLAPAAEELLPPSVFGDHEAADLIEEWWGGRAAALWAAAGLDRLTAALPPAAPSRLHRVLFSELATQTLQDRCQAEGVTLNGAVAVALRDVTGGTRIAHSIDMHRFIRPALAPAPGIAVSHLFTDLPATGEFWETARHVRGALFEAIQRGEHGDALLILPRVLLRGDMAAAGGVAGLTITGFPTLRAPGMAAPDPDQVMQLVLSSARGGGDIMILSHDAGRLQLLAGSPLSRPALDLGAVAARLLAVSVSA